MHCLTRKKEYFIVFPNLKVIKDNENGSNELSNSEKGYTRSWTKRGITRVKSPPKENPTERQIDKTKQVMHFNFVFGIIISQV